MEKQTQFNVETNFKRRNKLKFNGETNFKFTENPRLTKHQPWLETYLHNMASSWLLNLRRRLAADTLGVLSLVDSV